MNWWLLYGLGGCYWIAAWGQEWADATKGSVHSRTAGRRMLLAPVWPYAALWLATHRVRDTGNEGGP